MAGSAALASAPVLPGGSDPVLPVCRTLIRLNSEHDALIRRWQTLETHLVHRHNWFRLSEAERLLLPEAAEMSAIEARLHAVIAARSDLLTRLPDMKAASLRGVWHKLSVAALSVFPDENPEAHALLRSTLDDLRAILEPGGRPDT